MFGIAEEPYVFVAIGKTKEKLKAAVKDGVGEKLENRVKVIKALEAAIDLFSEPATDSVIEMRINIQFNNDECVYYDVDVCTKSSTFS